MTAIKPGVRTIGLDDGPFDRRSRGDVLVVGAIYRGADFDGLLTTRVRKDGWNATDAIASMLLRSKFLAQLHYIMLDGIAFGGFNVVDIDRLHRETGLKLLVVVRRRPDLAAVKRAVMHLPLPEKRLALIASAGEIVPIDKLFCQMKGMQPEEAKALLRLTCTRSHLPEPLRAAHLIAGGVILGQSGHRA